MTELPAARGEGTALHRTHPATPRRDPIGAVPRRAGHRPGIRTGLRLRGLHRLPQGDRRAVSGLAPRARLDKPGTGRAACGPGRSVRLAAAREMLDTRDSDRYVRKAAIAALGGHRRCTCDRAAAFILASPLGYPRTCRRGSRECAASGRAAACGTAATRSRRASSRTCVAIGIWSVGYLR
jgi:hypothetical protein